MTLSKPIVLVDCDGVLADFIGGVLSIVGRYTGREHSPEEIDQFDFCAALGLPATIASAVKRDISHSEGFCSRLAVFPGAVEGIAALSKIADVHIVTSPWNSCPTWTHEREAWLKKHFGIPHSRVTHTSAKHLFRGAMLVDDKTETVSAWRDAWPDGLPVLWSTPHNRNDRWGGPRSNSWSYVVELLHGPRIERGFAEIVEAT